MNRKQEKHTSKGITLIALVITIIVMLILVAVTIQIAVNGGLFEYAGRASGDTKDEIEAEQQLANGRVKIAGIWYDSIDDYINGIVSEDQPSPKDNVKDEHPGELEVIGTDTYEINSIEDLLALAYSVNKGETTYLGKTIELGKNLDFENDVSYANPEAKYVLENTKELIGYRPVTEGEEGTSIKALLVGDSATGFIPIGRDPGVGFYGTINGNYRTIKNMKETTTVTFGGIIGATKAGTQEKTEVNKLGIQNTNINTQAHAGGIIGYIYGSTVINNCYATGTITSKTGYAAGILAAVGDNDKTTIEINNCYNDGKIEAKLYAGGIMAYLNLENGTITVNKCYNKGTVTSTSVAVGGILGYAKATKIGINNCYNEGKMTSSNGFAGGIVGQTYYSNVLISNCYNKAEVTTPYPAAGILGYSSGTSKITINGSYNKGAITSKVAYAAGILAAVGDNDKTTIEINNCYNDGKIEAKLYAGGIMAYLNLENETITVNKCYNKGTVTSTDHAVGGILGYAKATKIGINNCYNEGMITSTGEPIGGVVASCNGTTTSIADCYNTGYIDGSIGSRGGIIGSNSSINITLTRCYNAGQVATNGKGDTNAQCIVGNIGSASDSNFTNTFYIDFNDNLIANSFAKKKTETEMKTDDFLEELKGSTNNTAWKRDPKKNNGMPILSWQ